MCTAISLKTKDHYFGRNLDLDYHYNESVTIMPRNMPLSMHCEKQMNRHYAIIGVATVDESYPLYYDATNECGLSIAGLNFPGNAGYQEPAANKYNITPFELIPWLLGKCKNLQEAKSYLKQTNIINVSYSEQYQLTPLHWMISDRTGSIVVEPMDEGLKVLNNPVGVLTNNPPFEHQMQHLNNYMSISRQQPENTLCKQIQLTHYSNGMGGIGLPGDLSSSSRFVRAVFTKSNSVCEYDEMSSVGQFFHILDAVSQINGSVQVGNHFEKTIYSTCCNTDKGIYYYTTYDNRQITAIYMHNSDLDSNLITKFPLIMTQQVRAEN